MNTFFQKERGQAIVVIAVVIVALLGMTALAIDGGMIYSDRRNAQNAADAAALAGALEKANQKLNPAIFFAIDNSISNNGFNPANTSKSISNLIHGSPLEGDYFLITVTLTDTTKTYFAQLFVGDEMKTVVKAIAKVRVSEPVFPGAAIVALGNCNTNNPQSNVGGNGGGNDGGIQANDGGIFANTPGGADCPINPPSSGDGIYTDHDIWSVGTFAPVCDGEDLTCDEVHTGVNAGVPIADPLGTLPEPTCTGPGTQVGSTWQPGTYSSIPTGNLAPGIYCVTGDTHMSGSESVESPDGGVLLYLKGSLTFSGNAFLNLQGPMEGNCLGAGDSPDDSCSYKGMVIFASRTNTGEIEIAGNGGQTLDGMIYAPNATVEASGGGNEGPDVIINGQIIAKNVSSDGGAMLIVNYNAGNTYTMAVQISLVR